MVNDMHSFRIFEMPDGPAITLAMQPALASWDKAGSRSQVRLASWLDHAQERICSRDDPKPPLALRLDVGLGSHAPLLQDYDLDNYLTPLVARIGRDVITSVWATKSRAAASQIRLETARPSSMERLGDWHFVAAQPQGSASTKAWKISLFEQVRVQAHLAPDGPLELQIAFRTGRCRAWRNLWKQTVDSLGPILGLTYEDRPFHPNDGRIVSLGLHNVTDDSLGHDVEIAIWWRAQTVVRLTGLCSDRSGTGNSLCPDH